MTLPRVGEEWSVQDDFVLMLLVGKETYAQIGLRLGRSASAVQRRASHKGYSAKQERRTVRETQTKKNAQTHTQNLNLSAEELADYLPEGTP